MVEHEDAVLSVPLDAAAQKPVCWSQVFNFEPCGEVGLELENKFSGFTDKYGVVDVNS
jgi:hypothetical protein